MPEPISDAARRLIQELGGTPPADEGGGLFGEAPDSPFAAEIEAAARKYGVDPTILTRMASQESAFNTGAVSPKGAQGLFQFMPDTAAQYGIDPWDPAQAAMGAAAYYKDLLDQFGSPELALAAYNAGPGKVLEYGGIPPYEETQNYVSRILGGGPLPGGGGVGARPSLGAGPSPSGGLSESALQLMRELGTKQKPYVRQPPREMSMMYQGPSLDPLATEVTPSPWTVADRMRFQMDMQPASPRALAKDIAGQPEREAVMAGLPPPAGGYGKTFGVMRQTPVPPDERAAAVERMATEAPEAPPPETQAAAETTPYAALPGVIARSIERSLREGMGFFPQALSVGMQMPPQGAFRTLAQAFPGASPKEQAAAMAGAGAGIGQAGMALTQPQPGTPLAAFEEQYAPKGALAHVIDFIAAIPGYTMNPMMRLAGQPGKAVVERIIGKSAISAGQHAAAVEYTIAVAKGISERKAAAIAAETAREVERAIDPTKRFVARYLADPATHGLVFGVMATAPEEGEAPDAYAQRALIQGGVTAPMFAFYSLSSGVLRRVAQAVFGYNPPQHYGRLVSSVLRKNRTGEPLTPEELEFAKWLVEEAQRRGFDVNIAGREPDVAPRPSEVPPGTKMLPAGPGPLPELGPGPEVPLFPKPTPIAGLLGQGRPPGWAPLQDPRKLPAPIENILWEARANALQVQDLKRWIPWIEEKEIAAAEGADRARLVEVAKARMAAYRESEIIRFAKPEELALLSRPGAPKALIIKAIEDRLADEYAAARAKEEMAAYAGPGATPVLGPQAEAPGALITEPTPQPIAPPAAPVAPVVTPPAPAPAPAPSPGYDFYEGDERRRALGEGQRGEPEAAMVRLQSSQIAQLYGWVAEHVGDLTNRLAMGNDDAVDEKIAKTLRALEHPYGFEKEVHEQIVSNAKGRGLDPELLRADLKELRKAYADAHRALVPYDKQTRLAQHAAIAIGEWRFTSAINALRSLQKLRAAQQPAAPAPEAPAPAPAAPAPPAPTAPAPAGEPPVNQEDYDDTIRKLQQMLGEQPAPAAPASPGVRPTAPAGPPPPGPPLGTGGETAPARRKYDVLMEQRNPPGQSFTNLWDLLEWEIRETPASLYKDAQAGDFIKTPAYPDSLFKVVDAGTYKFLQEVSVTKGEPIQTGPTGGKVVPLGKAEAKDAQIAKNPRVFEPGTAGAEPGFAKERRKATKAKNLEDALYDTAKRLVKRLADRGSGELWGFFEGSLAHKHKVFGQIERRFQVRDAPALADQLIVQMEEAALEVGGLSQTLHHSLLTKHKQRVLGNFSSTMSTVFKEPIDASDVDARDESGTLVKKLQAADPGMWVSNSGQSLMGIERKTGVSAQRVMETLRDISERLRPRQTVDMFQDKSEALQGLASEVQASSLSADESFVADDGVVYKVISADDIEVILQYNDPQTGEMRMGSLRPTDMVPLVEKMTEEPAGAVPRMSRTAVPRGGFGRIAQEEDAWGKATPELRKLLIKAGLFHFYQGKRDPASLLAALEGKLGVAIRPYIPGLIRTLESLPAFRGKPSGPTQTGAGPAGQEVPGGGPGVPAPKPGGTGGVPEAPAGGAAPHPPPTATGALKKPPADPHRLIREGGVATPNYNLYPSVKQAVLSPKDIAYYAQKLGFKPLPHQVENVNRAAMAFEKEHAFLIGDSTGTGKTASAALIMDTLFFKRNPDSHVVYVVRNHDLRMQAYKDVLEPLGIKQREYATDGDNFKPGKRQVNFITYNKLREMFDRKRMGKLEAFNPDLVVIDESQALINWFKGVDTALAGELATRLSPNTRTLFMSATPYESILHTGYLTSTRLWWPKWEAPDKTDPGARWGGWMTKTLGIRWDQVQGNWIGLSPKKLKNFYDSMLLTGRMTKSEIDFASIKDKNGKPLKMTVKMRMVPMTEAHEEEYDRVGSIFEQILADTKKGSDRRIIASMRYMVYRALDESQKIDQAIELAKEGLKRGFMPILTTFRKGETDFAKMFQEYLEGKRKYAPDSPMPVLMEILKSEGVRIESPVKRFAEAFPQFVHVTGDQPSGGWERKMNLKGLIDNTAEGAIITMSAGGTGISAHDKIGDKMRLQINVSLPDTAREMVQVQGRSFRLGSQSDTIQFWLYNDTPTQRKKATVMGHKNNVMGATVEGITENATADELLKFDFPEIGPEEAEVAPARSRIFVGEGEGDGEGERGPGGKFTRTVDDKPYGAPGQRSTSIEGRPLAPVRYKGFQEGIQGKVKGFDLWDLTEDIPGHKKGSTVSTITLEKAGYVLPAKGEAEAPVVTPDEILPANVMTGSTITMHEQGGRAPGELISVDEMLTGVGWRSGRIVQVDERGVPTTIVDDMDPSIYYLRDGQPVPFNERLNRPIRSREGTGGGGTAEVRVGDLRGGGTHPYAAKDVTHVPQNVAGNIEKVKGRYRMVMDLLKKLDTRFGKGRMGAPRSAMAWYKPGIDVIRARMAADIDSIAHEAGHRLDKILFGLGAPGMGISKSNMKIYKKELVKISTPPHNMSEGFAEFIRFYITDRAKAQQVAPNFFTAFESMLNPPERRPKLLDWAKDWGNAHAMSIQHQADNGMRDLRIILDGAKADYEAHTQGTDEAVMDSTIESAGLPGNRLPRKLSWMDFQRVFLDDMYAVREARDRMIKMFSKPFIAAGLDPNIQASLVAGRWMRALAYAEYYTFDFGSPGAPKGEPLKAIYDDIGTRWREYEWYAKAKRALDLFEQRGWDPFDHVGIHKDRCERIVAKYRDEMQPYFNRVKHYAAGLMDYLVGAGLLSPRARAQIAALNLDYSPLLRIFDPEERLMGGFGGAPWANLWSPIKGIKGDDHPTMPSIEALYKYTLMVHDRAEKNDLVMNLVKMARMISRYPSGAMPEGVGDMVEEVPKERWPHSISVKQALEKINEIIHKKYPGVKGITPQSIGAPEDLLKDIFEIWMDKTSPPEAPYVWAWENGERIYVRLSPYLYDAIAHIDARELNWLNSIASKDRSLFLWAMSRFATGGARTLRFGAVGVSPRYWARAVFRDIPSGGFYSSDPLLWGARFVQTMAEMFIAGAQGKTALIEQKYMAGGGGMGTMIGLRPEDIAGHIQRRLYSKREPAKAKRDPKHIAMSLLEGFQAIGQRLDLLPRIAEARVEGLDKATGRSQVSHAVYRGRETPQDYNRIGLFVRMINSLSAFYGANAGGRERFFREMLKEHPARFWWRMALFIGLPTILYYLSQREDPRWRNWPQSDKDRHWIIFPPEFLKAGIPKDMEWYADVPFRIPKPYDISDFGTGAERALEAWENNDPQAFKAFGERVFWDSPLDPWAMVPDTILPILEVYMNHNTRFNRPVHPERGEPYTRAYASTTETAKTIAEKMYDVSGGVINIAPTDIEHVASGYTGGLGRGGFRAADTMAKKMGGIEVEPPYRQPADLPIVGGFYGRAGTLSTETTERFYKELDRVRLVRQTYNLFKKQDPDMAEPYGKAHENELMTATFMERVAKDVSPWRSEYYRVREDPKLDGKEKMRQMVEISKRIDGMLGEALDILYGPEGPKLPHAEPPPQSAPGPARTPWSPR